MNASSEAIIGTDSSDASADVEAIFRAQYTRIAQLLARVTREPARAEEIAVEVFLKWAKTPGAQGEQAEGWLYRTAVRMGLDELRRRERRTRYEQLLSIVRRPPTPEEAWNLKQDQQKVQAVLSAIKPREAELLLLRSHGLSYEETAAALKLNPASVGTLIGRAQQAFRKEYVKRYGTE